MKGVFITEVDPDPAGVPLAVKDLFDTAGIRTTYGSAIFRDHVPTATAEAVARLERAGYSSAGKANLHEFAWGITSENPHHGTVPNPRAAGRVAGGSSGGSAAAVAAGLAAAGLGTDSGGCERMMEALAPAYAPARLESLADLRVGLTWTHLVDPLVRERVEAAASLFPNLERVEAPLPDGVAPLFEREAAEVHADLWHHHRADYGDNVGAKLERAMRVTDAEAAAAAHARELYRERMAGIGESFDLIASPTLAMVAPPVGIGDLPLRPRMLRLTYPWNATGWPALALPCGAAEHGLPASLQLAGRVGHDALVLAAGRLLERALAEARVR